MKCEYLSLKMAGDEECCPICTLSDSGCPFFHSNNYKECDDYFNDDEEEE